LKDKAVCHLALFDGHTSAAFKAGDDLKHGGQNNFSCGLIQVKIFFVTIEILKKQFLKYIVVYQQTGRNSATVYYIGGSI
jgi:hypothetical protein